MTVDNSITVSELGKLCQHYPLLFEPHVYHSDNDYPKIYLRDKEITPRGLYLVDYTFGSLFLKTEQYDNMITFYINLDDHSGVFTMDSDLMLSDQKCMLFFDYNIEVRYSEYTHSGPIFIDYDRQSITRRQLIKEIIKNEK